MTPRPPGGRPAAGDAPAAGRPSGYRCSQGRRDTAAGAERPSSPPMTGDDGRSASWRRRLIDQRPSAPPLWGDDGRSMAALGRWCNERRSAPLIGGDDGRSVPRRRSTAAGRPAAPRLRRPVVSASGASNPGLLPGGAARGARTAPGAWRRTRRWPPRNRGAPAGAPGAPPRARADPPRASRGRRGAPS